MMKNEIVKVIQSNDVERVKTLISAGTCSKKYVLYQAVIYNRRDIIKLVLDDCDCADIKDAFGWAVSNRRIGTIKLLLKHGIDKQDPMYGYSLHVFSSDGDIKTIKLMLQAGVDVNDGNDSVALYWAVHHGHIEAAKLLIKAGANIHTYDDYVLRCACDNNDIELIKVALQAGANVHAANDDALRSASRHGYALAVIMLLEAGADVSKLKWNFGYPVDLMAMSVQDIIQRIAAQGIAQELAS